MICEFCGLDPYEYVDIGIGYQAVAVNCCEAGYLMYDRGLSRKEIEKMLEWENWSHESWINYCLKEGCFEEEEPAYSEVYYQTWPDLCFGKPETHEERELNPTPPAYRKEPHESEVNMRLEDDLRADKPSFRLPR